MRARLGVLLLLLTAIAPAQRPEVAVRSQLDRMNAAYVRADFQAVRQILATPFTFVAPDGRTLNRRGFERLIGDRFLRQTFARRVEKVVKIVTRSGRTEVTSDITDEFAVRGRGRMMGQSLKVRQRVRAQSVWLRSGGALRLARLQFTNRP